jgi:hypothetical protein
MTAVRAQSACDTRFSAIRQPEYTLKTANSTAGSGIFLRISAHVPNPVKYLDPDGRINIPISQRYFMNDPSREWYTKRLTGDIVTIGAQGCAVTAIADLALTLGMPLNPLDINDKFVSNGDISWKSVAEEFNLIYFGKGEGPFTKAMFDVQETNTYNKYYTFVNVNYDTKEGPHWVGVKDVVSIKGKDYIEIAPTSISDINWTGNSSREGLGWTRKGARSFVPVDQVKAYVRYAKTE